MFEHLQPRPSPIRRWVFGGLMLAALALAVLLASRGLARDLALPTLYRVPHPWTLAVGVLLLMRVLWAGFDPVWNRLESRWNALNERLRLRRERRAAAARARRRTVQVSAHEVSARMRVLRGWLRVTLVGGLAVAGVYVGSVAMDRGFGPPIYTPRTTRAEALNLWCDGGVVVDFPPNAVCQLENGVRLDQASFRRFRDKIPPKWPRPRPPHPGVFAAILLALAWGVWRLVAPVKVRVLPNGVWFGRRFVQADDLRGVHVVWFLGRPRLILLTENDEIRTPPLGISNDELGELCGQLRRLVPSQKRVDEAIAERARLDPKMRALRELP